MNYNKLFKSILLAGLSLMLMVSCKKDDDVEIIIPEFNVTYNAGQPSDDGSEITAGKTWKSGDKLALLNVRSKADIVPMTYNGSTFSGIATNLYNGARLAFFYPYEAIHFSSSDTITYTLNMAGQDGTEATMKDYKSALSDSIKVTDDNISVSFPIKTLQAETRFKFNYQGKPISNMIRIELLAKEGYIFSERTFNFRKQDWSTNVSNSLVINNSKGLDGQMIVSMIPTESVLFMASIETANGLRYVGTATENASIESGKFYEFQIDCEISNVKAHIGDYYYNDGSFSKELDYGKTPVGIVFALTDKYGADINNNLSESLHGRVVSFKNLTTQKYRWANQSNLLYDLDALKSYAGAASDSETDSLAYLPYKRGNNEMTYYTDSCHINLSIDTATGHMKNWPTTGALSSFKGSENTIVCDSSIVKFPGAYQTHSLIRAGIGNKRWYLPSAGELALLYELWRQQVITAATKPGFIDFDEFTYWTSDENNASSAWAINFFNGMVFRNNKLSSYYIRPCILF